MADNSKKALWAAAPFAFIIVLAAVLFFWGKGVYNTLVVQDEKVKSAWSQVENQYHRRLQLIPNLVETVRGYAAHERESLEAVINARANAGKTVIDPQLLDQLSLQQFQSAQRELGSSLSRLMVVMEQYPELKANENFTMLQAQLESTENRIAVERKRFNDIAQEYNTSLRSFPTNMLAGLLGFKPRPYFAAESGAERAPSVKFTGSGK
ncbi:LemA family protein [Desulfovibrio sp. OttesenSCG-928-A18]|nr:LemA family protein [Desulfovibrio sp. OttesenSCG-928-A18]